MEGNNRGQQLGAGVSSRGAQGQTTEPTDFAKSRPSPPAPPAEGDEIITPVKVEEVALSSGVVVCGDVSVGSGSTAAPRAAGGRNKRKSSASAPSSLAHPDSAASGKRSSSSSGGGGCSSDWRRCKRSRQATDDDVIVLEPEELGAVAGATADTKPRSSVSIKPEI